MKVIVILFSIVLLFNSPVDSRQCYHCGCTYNWNDNSGSCTSSTFASSCTLTDFGNQYCYITSTYDGNNEQRVFEAIASTTFQDSHFIQAIERIALSGTAWLPTTISSISYGCDWDGCNDISLAQYLPDSFKMTIDTLTLNSALLNGAEPAQNCYSCTNCINELTATVCRQQTCTNGICYIDELHNYIVTPSNNCTYNFFSYCQPLNNPPQPPSIRIRATYYIDFPEAKNFEIDEVDIACTKENCNSIIVVENLKGQIQKTIDIPPGFQPSRQNDTTTTTRQTTTTPPGTGSSSGRFYPIAFLYPILILALL